MIGVVFAYLLGAASVFPMVCYVYFRLAVVGLGMVV